MIASRDGKFRVLYAGSLGTISTSTHRRMAIERLGHAVIEFDTDPYQMGGNRFLGKIRNRTLIGWNVHKLNRDLLEAAAATRPELIWFDKASYVHPRTLRRLRELGVYTVHFNIDNPFGPRRDPGRRLLLVTVPDYDLHLVQRDVNLENYSLAGARDVFLMRTSYEPSVHFPPPPGWSDSNRLYDAVFIGTPYDNRTEFLTALWRKHGIAVSVWGDHWPSRMAPDALAALWRGPCIYNTAYREAMWKSRICLAFITHSNRDDVAHKSFEIAACEAFMLAEDTPGHRAHFKPDEEAVFFRGVEDCAAKIRRYLPDSEVRARIAASGRRCAVASGYSNDSRIASVFEYIRQKLNRP
jgi:hypothetical protein